MASAKPDPVGADLRGRRKAGRLPMKTSYDCRSGRRPWLGPHSSRCSYTSPGITPRPSGGGSPSRRSAKSARATASRGGVPRRRRRGRGRGDGTPGPARARHLRASRSSGRRLRTLRGSPSPTRTSAPRSRSTRRRPDRRPHVLQLAGSRPRLLGRRPGDRVVRRARRLRPRDDSRSRQALWPPARRPPRCRARGLDPVYMFGQVLLARRGQRRLRPRFQGPCERRLRGDPGEEVERIEERRRDGPLRRDHRRRRRAR